MRKISKWQVFVIALASLFALFILFILGLFAYRYDYTSKIADKIWHDQQGRFSNQLFSASLSARFPKGTKLEEVQAFVKELKGSCRQNQKTMECTLPFSGSCCVASSIMIRVDVSNDKTLEQIGANIRITGW